ncbi:hypothetical protein [Shewanella surugensis]|uniref:Uncharacterized protein n=1 Tax=Shewanella surugensis TaxID=212020 RepID=A0ABT0LHR1_9GAMM|nr:hypothetical protein [Shewanella surugensis]MCL1126895.1 hypothetical protein [Shewanella surugensis]
MYLHYKKIINIILILAISLLPIYAEAGFFNKILNGIKSIVDPSSYTSITQYLGVDTITKIPYIKDSVNFIKSTSESAVKGGVSNTVNVLNTGITQITNEINDANIIKNLNSGLNTFTSTVNSLKIPQLLGSLPMADAESWGRMIYYVITDFTDCLKFAVTDNNVDNDAGRAQATLDGLTCFSKAAQMAAQMVQAIISGAIVVSGV